MIVIAVFAVVMVLTTLAELRKKPVIQKQLPSHPATLVSSELGTRMHFGVGAA